MIFPSFKYVLQFYEKNCRQLTFICLYLGVNSLCIKHLVTMIIFVFSIMLLGFYTICVREIDWQPQRWSANLWNLVWNLLLLTACSFALSANCLKKMMLGRLLHLTDNFRKLHLKHQHLDLVELVAFFQALVYLTWCKLRNLVVVNV